MCAGHKKRLKCVKLTVEVPQAFIDEFKKVVLSHPAYGDMDEAVISAMRDLIEKLQGQQTIQVTVPLPLRLTLDREAEKRGLSLSKLVEGILTTELKKT